VSFAKTRSLTVDEGMARATVGRNVLVLAVLGAARAADRVVHIGWSIKDFSRISGGHSRCRCWASGSEVGVGCESRLLPGLQMPSGASCSKRPSTRPRHRTSSRASFRSCSWSRSTPWDAYARGPGVLIDSRFGRRGLLRSGVLSLAGATIQSAGIAPRRLRRARGAPVDSLANRPVRSSLTRRRLHFLADVRA